MKGTVIFVLIIISSFVALGQKTDSSLAKNVVFIEAFGVGGYGSINYERFFQFKKNIAFGVRIGFSTLSIRDYNYKVNPDIVIPLAVNIIYGNKHRAEIGIGQTISNVVQANSETGDPERNNSFHLTSSIGYRYQKESGGIFIRIVYSPIYENYERIRHWGGLSIGYGF